MAFFFTETVSPTTNASGAVTAFTNLAYNGLVWAIVYTIDGTNPYANNVVIAVTGETSGVSLWSQTLVTNASATLYPSAQLSTQAGAGVGSTIVTRLPLANERISIAITSGGNTKVGKFQFIIGG